MPILKQASRIDALIVHASERQTILLACMLQYRTNIS